MRLRATGMDGREVDAALDRLEAEDVLGQLRRREGRAAELGSEGGRPQLDWIDALDRLLADRHGVADVRRRAETLLGDSAELVWAGMGGSVQAVRCLCALSPLPIRPLDSTDPARLRRLWEETDGLVAAAVGVAMGLTSEEPLTHLRWFREATGRRRPAAVMAIAGSVLEAFARDQRLPTVPLQPDGGAGTPGRMSAPGTHVFLVPAALALGDELEPALRSIQAADRSPFVRLAAWLHTRIAGGAGKILLDTAAELLPLEPWIEQVVEESLGKGGRGLLVFPRQEPGLLADPPPDCTVLRLGGSGVGAGLELAGPFDITAAGELMAGWCLAVALLGYLEGITFAGQPAVEGYKRHARELRDAPGELPLPPAAPKAPDLTHLMEAVGPDGYLDLTLNADECTPGWQQLSSRFVRQANLALRRPAKVRIAPAHYHSTEQAQVDGPPGVASIRLLILERSQAPGADYPPRFLHAQALGTARAMEEAGRPVTLLALRREEGLAAVAETLR